MSKAIHRASSNGAEIPSTWNNLEVRVVRVEAAGNVLRLDGVLTESNTPMGSDSRSSGREVTHAVIPEVEWRQRERQNIRTALELANGRIYGPDGAAALLGVKPTTLISRLKALGLRNAEKRSRRRARGST